MSKLEWAPHCLVQRNTRRHRALWAPVAGEADAADLDLVWIRRVRPEEVRPPLGRWESCRECREEEQS